MLGIAALSLPAAVQAQGSDEIPGSAARTRITLGAQVVPAFPGSEDIRWRPAVDVDRARSGEQFGFESPDDSFGISLVRSGGFAFGPVIDTAGSRTPEKVGAALPKVSTSVELGGFVLHQFGENFRLYGEVRKAVSGHDGLVASAGADVILRDGDAWVVSLGPRIKWADGKWHDAYFSVTPADSVASGLPAYDAGSGIQAAGAVAGAEVQLGERWGLYGFAAYDRLVRDAARSPVTRQLGSRDQFAAGLALSYVFGR